jgi:transposase
VSGIRVWKAAAGLDGRVVIEGQELSVARGGIVVRVRPHARQRLRCGRCGRRAVRYDGGEGRRVWRHLDFGTLRVWLEADAPRVSCVEHGPTVLEVPWARHNSGHTRAFDAQVAWLAVHTAKSVVQRLMRVGWRTVGGIVARVKTDLDAGIDRLAGLRRIGIDEISYKKGHKYLTVIVDHDSGRLVWARPGNTTATLNAFFDKLGEQGCAQVTHVSADGAGWITQVVAKRCPNALRAADPYHVVAWAVEALDATRREVWNTLPGRRHANKYGSLSDSRAVKRARWALVKNPEDLTPGQQAKLDWIAKAHPRLHRAYLLKEKLRLIFKLPVDEAETELDGWINWARRCRISQFVALARRITRHKHAILISIRTGLSNGRIEGINTKIRLLTRIAYGFRNPHALIALAMLHLGGYTLHLPWQTSPHTPHPRM